MSRLKFQRVVRLWKLPGAANIDIPTLCYLKGINEIGACRMCLVEVKGARTLQASCVYPVSDGMEIRTNTPAVREARRVNLELILSNHDRSCLTVCVIRTVNFRN